MIVHVVMIKFKEEEKKEHMAKAKEMIDALSETVPSLLSMQTGVNFAEEERAMDLCLTAKFADLDGLREYAVHPEHVKVLEYLRKVVEYSKVVDYETV